MTNDLADASEFRFAECNAGMLYTLGIDVEKVGIMCEDHAPLSGRELNVFLIARAE
jgi:hypothetical protein